MKNSGKSIESSKFQKSYQNSGHWIGYTQKRKCIVNWFQKGVGLIISGYVGNNNVFRLLQY